jgi:hypothetical protein
MTHETIAALLEKHGLPWVHLAAPWGTDEEGAIFEAGNFIQLLAESPTA